MKIAILFLALFCFSVSNSQTIGLQSFATGFTSPIEISHPSGDSRLFVVQQEGIIKVVNSNGTVNTTPFLTLTTATVISGGERGLLGLAFHPNYASNGYFYVNYTRAGDGATVIARYSVSADPNVANASSGSVLLTIAQPFSNHNGGSVKFGPDSYLYIGMGDGGSGGDPGNRAQNINENLGKMLRIDVDSASPYGIPATNPYLGIAGNDEIWAVGMRNPWKFSFNRLNGDLWIADVGQNAIEEIHKVTSPLSAGLNFGWRCYEGNTAYDTSSLTCPPYASTAPPINQYTHVSSRCSITGGYVYTGTTYPNFQNKYFFGDYCTAEIGWVNTSGTITWNYDAEGVITTFGEDMNGELYVAVNSTIYKIIDTSLGVNTPEMSQFIIYPNPTNSEIIIQKSNENYPTEITLFDLSGKMILMQKTVNKTENIIKTNNLSKGLYIMTIKNDQGQLSTHRLLIE